MRTFLLGILLFLGLNLSASNDVNNTQLCHMDGFDVVCGQKRTPLPIGAENGFWSLPQDDPKHQLAVFYRQPIDAPGPGWEEYFIVDYKNMMVYDNKCLGSNFAGIPIGEDEIVYENKEGDFKIFKKEDLDHCKQSLETWLAKPYNPDW